jgi:hypothetical protein
MLKCSESPTLCIQNVSIHDIDIHTGAGMAIERMRSQVTVISVDVLIAKALGDANQIIAQKAKHQLCLSGKVAALITFPVQLVLV